MADTVGVQFFEVVKMGRLRQRQTQVIIIEHNDETGGKLRVMDGKGADKREIGAGDFVGIEKLDPPVEGKPEAAVMLKYLRLKEKGGGGGIADHSQTYIFDSEELRDTFIGAVVRMNPRVNVVNRQKGVATYAGTATLPSERVTRATISERPSSEAVTAALPDFAVTSRLETRSRAATVSSGSRAVNARLFGGYGVDNLAAVRRACSRRFFVMVENAYGCREPRVVALSETGGLLQLFDSLEKIRDEFALLQLRDVYTHCVDDTVLMLSFALGDGVSTTRTDVLVVFGTQNQRKDFIELLKVSLAIASPGMFVSEGADAAEAQAPVPWTVHAAWADPLPLHKWWRFEVLKVRQRRARGGLGSSFHSTLHNRSWSC